VTAGSGNYKRIYAVARRIPRGRVATYGQIAALAGLPNHARQVGYALQALPEASDVPWQRVVNASGGVSPRPHPYAVMMQRAMLEKEGIKFGANGKISLARYGWRSAIRVRAEC
jgi:methylated-DNA-protein-cysteine methyltransferase-like protein